MRRSTDTQGRTLYAGARRVQKRELNGTHGIYVNIICGRKATPPHCYHQSRSERVQLGLLRPSCAHIMPFGCYARALAPKRKQPVEPLHSAHQHSPALPPRPISEAYTLSGVHANSMTDSTSNIFSWADLESKCEGVMQRDEMRQCNHQVQ